jgi:hypothetical protein
MGEAADDCQQAGAACGAASSLVEAVVAAAGGGLTELRGAGDWCLAAGDVLQLAALPNLRVLELIPQGGPSTPPATCQQRASSTGPLAGGLHGTLPLGLLPRPAAAAPGHVLTSPLDCACGPCTRASGGCGCGSHHGLEVAEAGNAAAAGRPGAAEGAEAVGSHACVAASLGCHAGPLPDALAAWHAQLLPAVPSTSSGAAASMQQQRQRAPAWAGQLCGAPRLPGASPPARVLPCPARPLCRSERGHLPGAGQAAAPAQPVLRQRSRH